MERLVSSLGVSADTLKLDSVNSFQPNVLRHFHESAPPHFPIVGAVDFIGLIGVATIILEANSENR